MHNKADEVRARCPPADRSLSLYKVMCLFLSLVTQLAAKHFWPSSLALDARATPMSLAVMDESADMTMGDPSTGTGGVDGGQMGTDGVVLKLLLPEKETGHVIGKGGSVLTKIKLDSGARVRVSNMDEVIPMTRERVCTIVGTLPAVLLAQKLVSNALVENARPPMDEVRRIASASASTSASSSASSLASPLASP